MSASVTRWTTPFHGWAARDYLGRLRGVPVDECHLCPLVVPVANGDGLRHGL